MEESTVFQSKHILQYYGWAVQIINVRQIVDNI